jgi:hypothetical protein
MKRNQIDDNNSPKDWGDMIAEIYYKKRDLPRYYRHLTEKTLSEETIEITCKLGLWSVEGPRKKYGLIDCLAYKQWEKCHEEGKYNDAILSLAKVVAEEWAMLEDNYL